MKFTENIPKITDYYPLFVETGWNEILNLSTQNLELALSKSYSTISVYKEDELIGFGRIISDGVIYATIYDVIVKQEFQNQGIGTKIVQKLIGKCKTENIYSLNLFTAKGAEPFYLKLGFKARPQDAPGMKYEP